MHHISHTCIIFYLHTSIPSYPLCISSRTAEGLRANKSFGVPSLRIRLRTPLLVFIFNFLQSINVKMSSVTNPWHPLRISSHKEENSRSLFFPPRPIRCRQEDGPPQAAKAGAAVQRGRHHAGLPPPEHSQDVRLVPSRRRALGRHGVPRGRRADGHSHAGADGRGADCHRVQAVPQGTRLPPLAGRHTQGHQVGLDLARHGREGEAV